MKETIELAFIPYTRIPDVIKSLDFEEQEKFPTHLRGSELDEMRVFKMEVDMLNPLIKFNAIRSIILEYSNLVLQANTKYGYRCIGHLHLENRNYLEYIWKK